MSSNSRTSESVSPSADEANIWQTESEDANDDDMDYEVSELADLSEFKYDTMTTIELAKCRISLLGHGGNFMLVSLILIDASSWRAIPSSKKKPRRPMKTKTKKIKIQMKLRSIMMPKREC
jgi:hypothetical protein